MSLMQALNQCKQSTEAADGLCCQYGLSRMSLGCDSILCCLHVRNFVDPLGRDAAPKSGSLLQNKYFREENTSKAIYQLSPFREHQVSVRDK